MNGGIDCTCGHPIVNDTSCLCPRHCTTCAREDCCAGSWAQFEQMKARAKALMGGTS